MKTIESLDFPLRVYFKDGECHHDSAVIVFTHGAPAYVRASGPFVVYPWENIKHIIRVADEAQEPDITERMLQAEVAALTIERTEAKENALRLGTLLVNVIEKLSAAFGCRAQNPQDPAAATDLADRVKLLRGENARLSGLHTEKRLALHKALGLSDAEELDHAALCERVAMMREWRDEVGHPSVAEAGRLRLDLASVTEQRDVLKRQLEELRAEVQEGDSVKRVLQRQVDRLRHEPVLSQPKQVESGGPIWVRVVDASSPYFGLVGRLDNITSTRDGDDVWEVYVIDRHKHGNTLCFKSESFVVVGTGRNSPPVPTFEEQVKACRELNPTDEPNPDNRDSYRATALRAGAKDCTLFVGPKPTDLTFVVEMREGAKVFDVVAALEHEHGLQPEAYRIREVRAPMP